MRKYGKKAAKKVGRVMHEYKAGKLHSGKAGKKVTSRRQAVAIGISEARREGDKVPAKRSSRSSTSKSHTSHAGRTNSSTSHGASGHSEE